MCSPRVLLLALVAAAGMMVGQVCGRRTGTVVDPAGASIPNAKVSLLLAGGKTAVLTTTTNSEGIFDFLAVRPDLYNLEIEGAGFAKRTEAEVKIDPARQVQ